MVIRTKGIPMMPSLLLKCGGKARTRLLCVILASVYRCGGGGGKMGQVGKGEGEIVKILPLPPHQGYPSSSRLSATRCKQQIKTRLPQGRGEGIERRGQTQTPPSQEDKCFLFALFRVSLLSMTFRRCLSSAPSLAAPSLG